MHLKEYDFIIVGAGPAGCVLASRLASSSSRPQVLLVEAGGDNSALTNRIDADRYIHQLIPEQNWASMSIPQKHLNDRCLSIRHGKGLGGGTSINWSAWTLGPRDDFEHIAELVGDDEWRWKNVQNRYKRLERHHDTTTYGHRYAMDRKSHGYEGDLCIDFPAVVERDTVSQMDAAVEFGIPLCHDQNSGNPIGIGATAWTASHGRRVMAKDLFEPKPDSLTILTDTTVARVDFDKKRAIGVETSTGEHIRARHEVVLCAGPLQDPKILMHSGVGPESVLRSLDITIVQTAEQVGQNLQDHHINVCTWERAEHVSERLAFYKSKDAQAAARTQWEKDGTGPLSELATTIAIAFPKLDRILQTTEYQSLDRSTQLLLRRETVPHWELCLGGPSFEYFADAENTPHMTSAFLFLMNTQSRGSVTINSANPEDPVVIDANFFSHPFDKRLAVEATREVQKFAATPAFAKDTVRPLQMPRSDTEEDILEFWTENSISGAHPMGTCRIGKTADEGAIDKDFRIFGTENLRVCDTSVLPLLLNSHLQASSYLVGSMLSDKLIAEHGLNSSS